ncbi:MAG: twin-arginine translocase TatA/TatE family subunit [Alphaproteobacteria bacterium]|nr:twin-arginine translocase TatA/TatE family subunit [Alphaproteobacteria bacterium]
MTPLLIPNLGVPELLIILVLVMVFFGVGKLPQVFKTMGEGVKAFRDASNGVDEESSKGQIDVSPEARTVDQVREAEEVRRQS